MVMQRFTGLPELRRLCPQSRCRSTATNYIKRFPFSISMIIVLLGPPGSGKGTLSERLEKEFGLFHLSPGQLLREEVKRGTPLGKKIASYIDKGHLVPTNFVVEMVRLEMRGKKKVILDGFPRNREQAEAFADVKVDLVLYLDVSEKIAVERLSGRRVCTQQKHGFHMRYFPPKKKLVCDYDGSSLTKRKDDAPKVVKERFLVYEKETKPVIAYYRKKGLLMEVDGNGDPGDVYGAVKRIVRTL